MSDFKPLMIFQTPLKTRSGYGDRGRDLARSLIELYDDDYRIMFVPTRWGETAWDALKEGEDDDLLSRIAPPEFQPFAKQWPEQPHIFIQHTVPNEFVPYGKVNIGITAGIETTTCSPEFIEGCNRMNITLASSQHAKDVLEKPQQHPDGRVAQLMKPVEVLFEGVDLSIFDKKLADSKSELSKELNIALKEYDFGFLFVGHWLKGDMGHDRKDVGMLIRCFDEAFGRKTGKGPALILKTSSATYSHLDRDDMMDRITSIKNHFGIKTPVYLIHGELTRQEMNDLYNHRKVKAIISLQKGEGFGRPLLEATTSGKPVITTDFSGPRDFLHSDYSFRLPYTLTPVHKSASDDKFLLENAQWATVNYADAIATMKHVYENYKSVTEKSRKHIQYTKDNFTLDKMTKKLGELIGPTVKTVPVVQPLVLPNLEDLKLT